MRFFSEQISVWFGSIMILVVVSGAVAFTFTDFMDDRLYGNKRIFFICVLFAYAIYRAFRIYSVIKSKKHE